jgi:hypothetical protein
MTGAFCCAALVSCPILSPHLRQSANNVINAVGPGPRLWSRLPDVVTRVYEQLSTSLA